MPWFFAVAERDHLIQNPTTPQKILQLGSQLGLDRTTRVLDVAAGKCGPAVLLASEFGCRITCVERAPEFVDAARARIREAGVDDRIELLHLDALEISPEPATYDVVMCLGASFIWEGLDRTLEALIPIAVPSGNVVVGEPYWRTWPLTDGTDDEGFTSLRETVRRFESARLVVTGVIASSEDDWDAYESLHWRALEEWLRANPDDPDAPDIRQRHETYRDRYLTTQRDSLGWAIFAGRKPT